MDYKPMEFNLLSKKCPVCFESTVENIEDRPSWFKPPFYQCSKCKTKFDTKLSWNAIWMAGIFDLFCLLAVLWVNEMDLSGMVRMAVLGGIATFGFSVGFNILLKRWVFIKYEEPSD